MPLYLLFLFLISAHLYAALLDDIMMLQRRGIELHEFYAKKIYAEEHYEVMTTPLDHTHTINTHMNKISYTISCYVYTCIHALTHMYMYM